MKKRLDFKKTGVECNKTDAALMYRVVGVVLLILCMAISAFGANDLLLMPAEKTDMADVSILMDVVNVQGRLVAVGERGHILYSDDKCAGWTQADVPVSVNLTKVYFPDGANGWAVGHDGVVLHTTDGGKTWVKQLDGYEINDLMLTQQKALIRAKTDLMEGENSGLDESQKEILALELEDLDFFLSDLEMFVEEGPTRPLMDVWFTNDREGIVIGAFGIILETRDGGETWNALMDRIDNPEGFHYYGITRSGDTLFIAGEAGLLYRSEDFGKTWIRLESPYEGSFFGIMGSPDGGFVTAFGLRGNIYCSLDNGDTWKRSDTGRKASLSGGTFLSDGSFCIAGVDGTVLRSTDRGKTFSPFSKRFPGSIAVAESVKGSVAVVGMKGLAMLEMD
jgi:photosystem II stability/assembly factor-like uncharacterized protein